MVGPPSELTVGSRIQIILHITRNLCSRWVELDMLSCWRQQVMLHLELRQYKIQNGVKVYTVYIYQLRLKRIITLTYSQRAQNIAFVDF